LSVFACVAFRHHEEAVALAALMASTGMSGTELAADLAFGHAAGAKPQHVTYLAHG
jgi:hypothetical protein